MVNLERKWELEWEKKSLYDNEIIGRYSQRQSGEEGILSRRKQSVEASEILSFLSSLLQCASRTTYCGSEYAIYPLHYATQHRKNSDTFSA